MTFRYCADEVDEFKYRRDLHEAREASLVNAAFADILAGKTESEHVHAALKLGTHPDYQRLQQARDDAIRAARHSGATT